MTRPRWMGLVLVLAGALGTALTSGQAVPAVAPTTPTRQPEKLKLALVQIAETDPFEYLFVVNDAIGFKSVESLKKFVAGMIPGSTLTWDPGCVRMGKEPILSSPQDLEAFKAFCADHKVELIIIPSG